MQLNTKITKVTFEMLDENYKIIKKFAIDRNTTVKELIIKALTEYISRNMGN